MAATLQSLYELLVSMRTEQAAFQAAVTAKLDAIQAAQAAAPPRRPRSTAATTTHVGTDAVNGQSDTSDKPAANTILYIKAMHAKDPSFWSRKMTPGNYEAMEAKHADAIKDIANEVDRRKKLSELIWKELGELATKSKHKQTKDFALDLQDHLRKEWKDAKTAWEEAHPKVTSSAASTSTVLVPDMPVLNQTVAQPQTLTNEIQVPSLVTPLNLSLSMLNPAALHQ